MTSPTPPVHPSVPAAPSSANATTAGAVASVHAPTEKLTSNSKINSLSDLKNKAPELYKKMLQGIAMSICGEMRQHQERLKKLMREATDQR